jgi:hypothetical protein
MMSILGDKERAVIDTITMRFHAPEALVYLENLGMKMGIATYYRYKKKVGAMKLERMQFIADHFQELHLEKIDRLELIDRLMWQELAKETQPYRRVKILETIANSQATVSGYYESTTIALEISAKFNGHNNNNDSKKDYGPMKFDEWVAKNSRPRISDDSYYSEEENGQYYWDLHKKHNEYVKNWETQNFGPDPDPDPDKAWGSESNPPKAIVRMPSKTIVQISPH